MDRLLLDGTGSAAEHAADIAAGSAEARRPEGDPEEVDKEECVEVADDIDPGLVCPLFSLSLSLLIPLSQIFFPCQKDKVAQAPEDKGPVGPVPDAGQKPHSQHIKDVTAGGAPVAAQGDVDIIPEPLGQGHMPPVPEVRDAGRLIGGVEVLPDLKAQELPDPDRHIRVAGKVIIELEGIGDGPDPEPDTGIAVSQSRPVKIIVGQIGHLVGDQDLFAQAGRDPLHGRRIIAAGHTVSQSPRKLPVADDGPGGHGREKGQIEPGPDQRRSFFNFSLIKIHQEGDRLKGHKGDPRGDKERGHIPAGPGHRIYSPDQKGRVLDHDKGRRRQDQGESQDMAAPDLFHQDREKPDQDREGT